MLLTQNAPRRNSLLCTSVSAAYTLPPQSNPAQKEANVNAHGKIEGKQEEKG